jgi:replication factor C subunit 3/5
MFFIDKYSPKTIEDAYFHKDVLNKLKLMCEDDSVPHIIFYGPDGCGKKTLINMFLEMRYDKNVYRLLDCSYTVSGSGNSTTAVTVKQSKHHIVIEPNNNNFDRYLIQDIVKEYARHPRGLFSQKNSFRTVLINNVDNLSYYAQTSLRRTMEQYSGACRFIMWSRSLSKVIEPLRSRCICLKIRSPTEGELFEYILQISSKEKLNLSIRDFYKINTLADRNVKRALWLLELKKLGIAYETTYDQIVDNILTCILTTKLKAVNFYGKNENVNRPIVKNDVRDWLYRILITNIEGSQIIKDITNKIVRRKDITFECKSEIVEKAAKYEHNLIRGRREIIHLEAFILGVMTSIYNHTKLDEKN